MPVCPNCSHEFPKIENILLSFRSKLCSKCGINLKHDSQQFVLETFLFGIVYSIWSALVPYEKGGLTIMEDLSFTHAQITYFFLFIWFAFLYICIFQRKNYCNKASAFF